jgi:hypothetical protein
LLLRQMRHVHAMGMRSSQLHEGAQGGREWRAQPVYMQGFIISYSIIQLECIYMITSNVLSTALAYSRMRQSNIIGIGDRERATHVVGRSSGRHDHAVGRNRAWPGQARRLARIGRRRGHGDAARAPAGGVPHFGRPAGGSAAESGDAQGRRTRCPAWRTLAFGPRAGLALRR